MAYRFAASVIRGVLDFQKRGTVTGSIDLVGGPGRLELRLTGCPWRDLAGYRLEFRNPNPVPGKGLAGLSPSQEGAVGDITASRKVKVPDVPIEELRTYYKTGAPLPFHWANSLYLEWFSTTNGRIIIETADFELRMTSEPTWTMTVAEEEQQRIENRGALEGIFRELGELNYSVVPLDEDPDEPTSRVEAEAEAETARMNLLLDRISHRMEREELPEEEFERVMDEERERLRIERGEPAPEPLTPEEAAREAEWIDEMNAASAEAVREADDSLTEREHPLVIACRELAIRLHHEGKRKELMAQGASPEHPIIEMMDGVMIASAKLAGVLNTHLEDREWPPDRLTAGNALVRLKKARRYLEDAIEGINAAEEQRLAEPVWLSYQRQQIESIHHSVVGLIQEVRDSL